MALGTWVGGRGQAVETGRLVERLEIVDGGARAQRDDEGQRDPLRERSIPTARDEPGLIEGDSLSQ